MRFQEEDSFVIKFVSGESYEKETLTLCSQKLYIDRSVNRININIHTSENVPGKHFYLWSLQSDHNCKKFTSVSVFKPSN